jgi:hypothetical protein
MDSLCQLSQSARLDRVLSFIIGKDLPGHNAHAAPPGLEFIYAHAAASESQAVCSQSLATISGWQTIAQ